jgi:hypothetical protein
MPGLTIGKDDESREARKYRSLMPNYEKGDEGRTMEMCAEAQKNYFRADYIERRLTSYKTDAENNVFYAARKADAERHATQSSRSTTSRRSGPVDLSPKTTFADMLARPNPVNTSGRTYGAIVEKEHMDRCKIVDNPPDKGGLPDNWLVEAWRTI